MPDKGCRNVESTWTDFLNLIKNTASGFQITIVGKGIGIAQKLFLEIYFSYPVCQL